MEKNAKNLECQMMRANIDDNHLDFKKQCYISFSIKLDLLLTNSKL